MGTQTRIRLAKRISKEKNSTARGNDLGDLQFVILCAIRKLSPRASVSDVLRLVLDNLDDMMDVSQTYHSIMRFSEEKVQYIAANGKARSEEGGRDAAVFMITDAGEAAIKDKIEHMQRLLEVPGLLGQAQAQ